MKVRNHGTHSEWKQISVPSLSKMSSRGGCFINHVRPSPPLRLRPALLGSSKGGGGFGKMVAAKLVPDSDQRGHGAGLGVEEA